MTPPPPSRLATTHAYRHLFRHGLRAVQFSKPARYVVRDRIRAAFRAKSSEQFDPARVERTLEFLDGATRSKGLEHRLLKRLMHVWWERGKVMRAYVPTPDKLEWRKEAYREFDRTVGMLEESMGLCLG